MDYWDLSSYATKNAWAGDEEGEVLWLLTSDEYEKLLDGTRVKSIRGIWATKGKDYIDDDTRFGMMAYGLVEYLV